MLDLQKYPAFISFYLFIYIYFFFFLLFFAMKKKENMAETEA